MGSGGQNVLHRGELLGDEARDLAHGAVLDDDGQVEAAAHQINALDLMVRVDLTGDLVEAHALLRRDLDLDERGNALTVGLVPVDESLVAENGAVLFIVLELRRDLVLGRAGHGGELGGRKTGVLAEQVEQFFGVLHNNQPPGIFFGIILYYTPQRRDLSK